MSTIFGQFIQTQSREEQMRRNIEELQKQLIEAQNREDQEHVVNIRRQMMITRGELRRLSREENGVSIKSMPTVMTMQKRRSFIQMLLEPLHQWMTALR